MQREERHGQVAEATVQRDGLLVRQTGHAPWYRQGGRRSQEFGSGLGLGLELGLRSELGFGVGFGLELGLRFWVGVGVGVEVRVSGHAPQGCRAAER